MNKFHLHFERLRAPLLLVAALAILPWAPGFSRQSGQVLPAVAADKASAATVTSHSRPRRFRALDKRIDAIHAASDVRRGSWGIDVIELANGRLLYERDADHLFIPASNMKMFTTAAALEKLGPDYTCRTTIESDAAPDADGHVGNLYVVGRGDPNLGMRTFPYTYHGPAQPADKFLQDLADQVKARGVRAVDGSLVADDSYFLWEPFAPNWAADDLEWGYGAPVTALAFNDNSLILHIKPGTTTGQPAMVSLEPVADYYQLKQHVETSAPGTKQRVFVERLPGSMELDVWGQIPVDSDEDIDTVAILNAPRLVAELFRQALEARGIAVKGGLEVRHSTRFEAASQPDVYPQSPSRVVLAEHHSPPLREAIKAINKESQNLHAEMLLRTLGRVVNHYGSLTIGLETLNQFMTQQVGIVPGETYFSDGSGLSREDLVAPQAAVKLLIYMAHSPNFQAYWDSLPVSGIDGTLAHRLSDDQMKGKIHAKTGSVEHVNTLSGYMDLPSGKRLVFSIMANNHPLPNKDGQQTLDAIAEEIYRWFAKRVT